MREEDQQTITVEVELKRPDSEPTFSVPQPSPVTRYSRKSQKLQAENSLTLLVMVNLKKIKRLNA